MNTQNTNAAELYHKIEPILANAGITRVADLTGLDWLGIPVWMAVRPNSYSLSVSQGKGFTADEARLGAVMESLENYVAERPSLATRRASYSELMLESDAVVDPLTLPRLLNSLYTPDYQLLWTSGIDMFSGKPSWVPLEAVNLDFRLKPLDPQLFLQSSSGLASGFSLEEARYHALTEVLERDAWTLFMDTVPAKKWADYQIAEATITNQLLQNLLARIKEAQLKVVFLNITMDIKPYSVTALLFEDENCQRPLNQHSCFFGSSCHFDPQVAMIKALMEALQSRITLISGGRDDFSCSKYEDNYTSFYWEVIAACFKYDGHFGQDLSMLPNLDQGSTAANCDFILQQLAAAAIKQAVLFDLSLPGWPIKVVRVVVPFMETAFHIKGITRGRREQLFKELNNG